jgi:hypothetical protein
LVLVRTLGIISTLIAGMPELSISIGWRAMASATMTEHEQMSDERCEALVAILREVDYRLQWGQVHEARLLIQHQLGDDEDGKESELGHD